MGKVYFYPSIDAYAANPNVSPQLKKLYTTLTITFDSIQILDQHDSDAAGEWFLRANVEDQSINLITPTGDPQFPNGVSNGVTYDISKEITVPIPRSDSLNRYFDVLVFGFENDGDTPNINTYNCPWVCDPDDYVLGGIKKSFAADQQFGVGNYCEISGGFFNTPGGDFRMCYHLTRG